MPNVQSFIGRILISLSVLSWHVFVSCASCFLLVIVVCARRNFLIVKTNSNHFFAKKRVKYFSTFLRIKRSLSQSHVPGFLRISPLLVSTDTNFSEKKRFLTFFRISPCLIMCKNDFIMQNLLPPLAKIQSQTQKSDFHKPGSIRLT